MPVNQAKTHVLLPQQFTSLLVPPISPASGNHFWVVKHEFVSFGQIARGWITQISKGSHNFKTISILSTSTCSLTKIAIERDDV
jgi:hypothetical protein